MSYNGPQFYDDAGVFATYSRHRENAEAANDTLEKPVIRQLLGDVAGHDFLDLGCGNALFGRELLAEGAASYLGVDGSRNMVAQAEQNLHGTPGRVVRAGLDAWTYPASSFSRVTSRLVIHYLADIKPLFENIYRSLRPGGVLVFSVEHPVITARELEWDNSAREDWLVDNYFTTGSRVTDWMGARVIKYHRTIEDYFDALRRCGFQLEGLRECRPARANFMNEETFLRHQRVPLFLAMAARKN